MTKGELKKLWEPFDDSETIYVPTGPVLNRLDELTHVQAVDPETGGIVLFANKEVSDVTGEAVDGQVVTEEVLTEEGDNKEGSDND